MREFIDMISSRLSLEIKESDKLGEFYKLWVESNKDSSILNLTCEFIMMEL